MVQISVYDCGRDKLAKLCILAVNKSIFFNKIYVRIILISVKKRKYIREILIVLIMTGFVSVHGCRTAELRYARATS